MKTSLYNIQSEYQQLMEVIMANDGEVDQEMEMALQINHESLETKAVNYAFVCKELDSQISIIESEIDRLIALKKVRSKTIERLKITMSAAMQAYGIEKIETPIMKISFRKSESIEIENIDLIDKKFIDEKTIVMANKNAIKNAIKSGDEVMGAILKINQNIQIK